MWVWVISPTSTSTSRARYTVDMVDVGQFVATIWSGVAWRRRSTVSHTCLRWGVRR
jgi:hypothetical protein